jgi:hypothetical protein
VVRIEREHPLLEVKSMSLESKLAAIREGAKARIPAELLATMLKATDDLRVSGILKNIIKVGANLPAFSLVGARGNSVDSAALLTRGPLVLTVFRGHW